jgi:hypothetical protein
LSDGVVAATPFAAASLARSASIAARLASARFFFHSFFSSSWRLFLRCSA